MCLLDVQDQTFRNMNKPRATIEPFQEFVFFVMFFVLQYIRILLGYYYNTFRHRVSLAI